MGLAEVRAAVLRNATKEAEAILAQARAEADAIVSAAKEKVAAERASFDAETATILGIMERRSTGEANARAKGIVLEAKREALTAARVAARERLLMTKGKERTALIEALCRAARDEGIAAAVRAAPADVATVTAALPEARVEADGSVAGGFVATNADGSIAVDCTFDTLLERAYERELLTVSGILFAGGTGGRGR